MVYHTKINIVMIMIFLSFILLLTYHLITFVEAEQNITEDKQIEDMVKRFIYNYTEMQPNNKILICSPNQILMEQWLNNPYQYKCYKV